MKPQQLYWFWISPSEIWQAIFSCLMNAFTNILLSCWEIVVFWISFITGLTRKPASGAECQWPEQLKTTVWKFANRSFNKNLLRILQTVLEQLHCPVLQKEDTWRMYIWRFGATSMKLCMTQMHQMGQQTLWDMFHWMGLQNLDIWRFTVSSVKVFRTRLTTTVGNILCCQYNMLQEADIWMLVSSLHRTGVMQAIEYLLDYTGLQETNIWSIALSPLKVALSPLKMCKTRLPQAIQDRLY